MVKNLFKTNEAIRKSKDSKDSANYIIRWVYHMLALIKRFQFISMIEYL